MQKSTRTVPALTVPMMTPILVPQAGYVVQKIIITILQLSNARRLLMVVGYKKLMVNARCVIVVTTYSAQVVVRMDERV